MTSPLDDGLAGARVLVTGASGGIGAAVCDAFVAAGAKVYATDVVDVSRPLVYATSTVDLRDTRACSDLVADAADALGGLDVVAHMAGILIRRNDLVEVSEADWDLQHDVNLKAAFFLLRAAAERMRAQGTGGRIVAASSQSWATGGFGGSTVYAAAKGGLVSLCRGMARSYGPEGISVNTVAPGAIETAMLTTDLSQDALDAIIASTPLRRLGTPQDVAGGVLFLSSARAAFITGATLNISGGWLVY